MNKVNFNTPKQSVTNNLYQYIPMNFSQVFDGITRFQSGYYIGINTPYNKIQLVFKGSESTMPFLTPSYLTQAPNSQIIIGHIDQIKNQSIIVLFVKIVKPVSSANDEILFKLLINGVEQTRYTTVSVDDNTTYKFFIGEGEYFKLDSDSRLDLYMEYTNPSIEVFPLSLSMLYEIVKV